MQTTHLMAKRAGETVYLRIIGDGNFKISPLLKKYLIEQLDNKATKVNIDMQNCEHVDSTFMGAIAGISRRLGGHANKTALCLNHVPQKVFALFSGIGLDNFIEINIDREEQAHCHEGVELENIDSALLANDSKHHKASLALEAHQHLAEISEENASRFRNVIDLLQEKVDRGKK